ncbi:MAG: ribonuclease Z [Desulfurococcaceae archaeon]
MPITRSLPCIALKADSDIYLFDPGEGCQVKMFKQGLSPLKVKAVFVTHAHGDHYLGLPGLLQSMTLSSRKDPLTIAGSRSFIEALSLMIKTGLIKPNFKVDLVPLSNEFKYVDSKISVKAFPVNHSIETYGFHITIGKKTVCYTGDTSPSETIIENCRNADVLIHEATFTSYYEQEAHEQKHSTALDAAKAAYEAGVKLLVLFHISARHSEEEVYFDAIRFFKNTVVARDGMIICL